MSGKLQKVKLKYRRGDLFSPFSKKQKLLRPIIPVSLKYKQHSIHYEALIDSGADFCIFPTGIANKLGLDFKKAQKIYFSGATGEPVVGFVGKVALQIGETTSETKIVFTDLDEKMALLGQHGFFELFKIKFNFKQEEIEIIPYNTN